MTRNNDVAAERTAFIIPDLRDLAGRIDVVLANAWIDRAVFLRDTMHALRQAAGVLSAAGRKDLPGQLAALADRLGVVLADSQADRVACLRETADALGPLAEAADADLRAAADRAVWVTGLRDLADFLAAHPDVPVPPAYHTQGITEFPDGDSDEQRRAAVDKVAGALGVAAAETPAGHYRASLSFGPLAYEVVAIPSQRQAEHSGAAA